MRGAWRALALAAAAVTGGSHAWGEESKFSEPATGTVEGSASVPESDSLIAQGIEFRKRREDRLALAAFERAWALGGSPRALAQVALAEQALGHWREAHEHLESALSHTDDPWISAHHATLDVALKEIASRLGAVEVSCNVDGAEVRVDGRVVGKTPLAEPVRVAAGKSIIEVVADGHFDALHQTQVDALGLARVQVALTPLAPLQSTAGRPPQPPPPSVAQAALPELAPVKDAAVGTTPDGASARDVLTYTTVGLAALGATVGVTGYVIREVNVKMYNDNERCNAFVGRPRSEECGAEYAAWRRGELMAIAGAASAGVFGLTALYLWWSEPDAADDGTALSCAVAGPSLTCGAAF